MHVYVYMHPAIDHAHTLPAIDHAYTIRTSL